MCGRFSRISPPETFAEMADAECEFELGPRYNILPGQEVLACRVDQDGTRRMVMMHWPYIPPFEKQPKTKYSTINAKAETLATSRLWQFPFKHFRCLIAADGFYEPKDTGEKRKPQYYFHRKDKKPFFMAGLWGRWEGEGDSRDTCAIVTTDANGIVGEVHSRMPVILGQKDYADWLDLDASDLGKLSGVLKSSPDSEWAGYHVGIYTQEDSASVINQK